MSTLKLRTVVNSVSVSGNACILLKQHQFAYNRMECNRRGLEGGGGFC